VTFLLSGSVQGGAEQSTESKMSQEEFCAEISDESNDAEYRNVKWSAKYERGAQVSDLWQCVPA